jgi:hypothetical protein
MAVRSSCLRIFRFWERREPFRALGERVAIPQSRESGVRSLEQREFGLGRPGVFTDAKLEPCLFAFRPLSLCYNPSRIADVDCRFSIETSENRRAKIGNPRHCAELCPYECRRTLIGRTSPVLVAAAWPHYGQQPGVTSQLLRTFPPFQDCVVADWSERWLGWLSARFVARLEEPRKQKFKEVPS